MNRDTFYVNMLMLYYCTDQSVSIVSFAFVFQPKKNRSAHEEYWAAGVGYGHSKRAGSKLNEPIMLQSIYLLHLYIMFKILR